MPGQPLIASNIVTSIRESLLKVSNDPIAEQKHRARLIGISIGSRLIHLISYEGYRVYTEKEKMKFICRDLWKALFAKNCDRLQTNRQHQYLVFDDNFEWISRYDNYPDLQELNGELTAGILEGALSQLGLSVDITVQLNPPQLKLIINVFTTE